MIPRKRCFRCWKQLINPFRKPVRGVEREVNGHKVMMHAVCADWHDQEQAALGVGITAQPSKP